MSRMKSVEDIAAEVRRVMRSRMYLPDAVWPLAVKVGLPGKDELESDIVKVHDNNNAIRRWADGHGCGLEYVTRRMGTPVRLVSKVLIEDEATALRVIGRRDAAEYRKMRERAGRLCDRLGVEPMLAMKAVRKTHDQSDVDFELLIRASEFFLRYDVAGRRPRAVPLAGFSAKWLDQSHKVRRRAIELLCGLDDLGLDERPRECRFRYLDPALHRSPDMVAVQPWNAGPSCGIRYVVICENKDTYQTMPPIDGGLCVFGQGFAASDSLPLLPWLFDDAGQDIHVAYWGDLDASGFEILSKVREAGVSCESVCMDRETYEAHREFGTEFTKDGKDIRTQVPQMLPGLTDEERNLYESLCTGEGVDCLRIEQERITMEYAASRLTSMGFPVRHQGIDDVWPVRPVPQAAGGTRDMHMGD
ncbi:DUF2399 domain-containing protein [Bifidobacterium sp. CP2]|uniref:DUF3322 and DUF2220 domain-containing protein n=1 Tax=Bifidobacterium sp. CP2 TaxID=2809025 RepID=UPI001BDC25B5|nr:DUF3322 and DUF2220 domain-containing protein [Bifidobacterium sp. CP2]MBT1180948.1 DUF2399 domain-containing protein [Bifidobacterium sp. CP2]